MQILMQIKHFQVKKDGKNKDYSKIIQVMQKRIQKHIINYYNQDMKRYKHEQQFKHNWIF